MKLFALISALAYASLVSPPPFSWYWAVQWAYVPFVWGAYYMFGGASGWYLLAYSLATAAVVFMAAFTAASFVLSNRFDRNPISTGAFSLIVAGCVSYVPYHAIAEMNAQMLVQLFEGAAMLACCLTMFFAAPFELRSTYRKACFLMAFLWLFIAGFRFGYILHQHSARWESWNESVPPVLVTVAALLTGRILSRRVSQELAQSQ